MMFAAMNWKVFALTLLGFSWLYSVVYAALEHNKNVAFGCIGVIWIAGIIFVAWLYPDKPKILPFRRKN